MTHLENIITSKYFWALIVWSSCGSFAFFYPEMDGLKFLAISGFTTLTGLFIAIGLARAVANKKMRKTTDCFHPYPELIKDED